MGFDLIGIWPSEKLSDQPGSHLFAYFNHYTRSTLFELMISHLNGRTINSMGKFPWDEVHLLYMSWVFKLYIVCFRY